MYGTADRETSNKAANSSDLHCVVGTSMVDSERSIFSHISLEDLYLLQPDRCQWLITHWGTPRQG